MVNKLPNKMCNSSSILRCTLMPDYSVQLSLIAVTIGVTNTLIVLQENHGITIMAVIISGLCTYQHSGASLTTAWN